MVAQPAAVVEPQEGSRMGDDVNVALFYIFILSLALLLVAYYAGVKTDVASFSSAINSLLLTATGRTSSGAFAAYPKQ